MPVSILQPAAHPRRGFADDGSGQRKSFCQSSGRQGLRGEQFQIIFNPIRGRGRPCSSVAGGQRKCEREVFPQDIGRLVPERREVRSAISRRLGLCRSRSTPEAAYPGVRWRTSELRWRAASRTGPALGPLSTRGSPRWVWEPSFGGLTAVSEWAPRLPPSLPHAPAPWRRSRVAGGSCAHQWERTSQRDADVALPRWRRVRREQPGRGEASEAE